MIPTTLSGVVLLLVFLLPGFVFVVVRERHRPARDRSAFRETATVLFVSAVGYVALAGALLIVCVFSRPMRETAASLLLDAGDLYIAHPIRFASSAAAVVLLVTVACAFAGSRYPRRLRQLVQKDYSPSDPTGSAWWITFETQPNADKAIGLMLDDGTWIGGTLFSWSRDAKDSPDRDLVLQKPIFVRSPTSDEPAELDDEVIIVSARRIVYAGVTYWERAGRDTGSLAAETANEP
jgi:hypothetical protein